jgi:2-iminobutanoate/2-iminopropanoate deaminase
MKTITNTNLAPLPIGPYNQAVAFNGLLLESGQIAIDPTIGTLVLETI